MKSYIYIIALTITASNALSANISNENKLLKTEVASLKEQLRDVRDNKRLKEERLRLRNKLKEEEILNNRDLEKFSKRVENVNRRIDRYNSLDPKNRSTTENQDIALELRKIEEERLRIYKKEIPTNKEFLKWK